MNEILHFVQNDTSSGNPERSEGSLCVGRTILYTCPARCVTGRTASASRSCSAPWRGCDKMACKWINALPFARRGWKPSWHTNSNGSVGLPLQRRRRAMKRAASSFRATCATSTAPICGCTQRAASSSSSASFTPPRFPSLREAGRLPWEHYLAPGQPIALRGTCKKSRLYHSGAVAERVAAAIANWLGLIQWGQHAQARHAKILAKVL